MGYFGSTIYISLTRSVGILLTSGVTTVRKLTTMSLSFFLFPKPFLPHYLFGAILAFTGLALQVWEKWRIRKNRFMIHDKYYDINV